MAQKTGSGVGSAVVALLATTAPDAVAAHRTEASITGQITLDAVTTGRDARVVGVEVAQRRRVRAVVELAEFHHFRLAVFERSRDVGRTLGLRLSGRHTGAQHASRRDAFEYLSPFHYASNIFILPKQNDRIFIILLCL